MPKRKKYEELSRSQQWRRRQETHCTVQTEIEISVEKANDILILENNTNNSNNDNVYMSQNVENSIDPLNNEESDLNDEKSDVESELSDEYSLQCYEDLNFNPKKEVTLRKFLQAWSIKNHGGRNQGVLLRIVVNQPIGNCSQRRPSCRGRNFLL